MKVRTRSRTRPHDRCSVSERTSNSSSSNDARESASALFSTGKKNSNGSETALPSFFEGVNSIISSSLKYDDFIKGVRQLTSLKAEVRAHQISIREHRERLQLRGNTLIENLKNSEDEKLQLLTLKIMSRHAKAVAELAGMGEAASAHFSAKSYMEGLETLDALSAALQDCIIAQTEAFGRPLQVVSCLEQWVPQATVHVKSTVTADLNAWFDAAVQAGNITGTRAFRAAEHTRAANTFGRAAVWRDAHGGRDKKLRTTSSWSTTLWNMDSGDDIKKRSARASTGASERSLRASVDSFDDSVLQLEIPRKEDSAIDDLVGVTELSTDALTQFTHVYDHISLREEAVAHYRAKRLFQCNVNSVATFDLYDVSEGAKFPSQCRRLLESLLGFFVIESEIRRKCAIIAEAELKNHWKVMCEQLSTVLQMQLDSNLSERSPAAFLAVADAVILMTTIVSRDDIFSEEAVGSDMSEENLFLRDISARVQFSSDSILDVLSRRKQRIGNALKSCVELELIKYLHTEPFAPFEPNKVEDDDLVTVLRACELHTVGEGVRFSETVPKCLLLFLNSSRDIFFFAQYLGCGVFDDPDAPKKSGGASVRRVQRRDAARCAAFHTKQTAALLASKLLVMMDAENASLGQICQLGANAEAFCDSMPTLDRILASWGESATGAADEAQSSSSLASEMEDGEVPGASFDAEMKCFQRVFLHCQDRAMEMVHAQIDDLLSSATFVCWTPTEVNDGPHDYMSDLVRYMDFCFCSSRSPIAKLQPKSVIAMHFTSCTRISNTLLEMLYGSDVAHFNSISIFNFLQDIRALKSFAERCKVDDLDLCFREAAQLTELLTSGNLEHILDADVRSQVYPHVPLQRLAELLPKFKELAVTRRLLSKSATRIKRLKRSGVKYVMEKLERIISNNS